ncbi:hypothetical protein [Empedobacter sp.]|uniref:hypothetical protein n=1 Tax=Empedobacter sp. TaxID=1927715 RepID=UPI002896948A|nr:hypothetical protein [Empedobacter sp.]
MNTNLKNILFAKEIFIKDLDITSTKINQYKLNKSKAFVNCNIYGDIILNENFSHSLFEEEEDYNHVLQFKECTFIDCEKIIINYLKGAKIAFINCIFKNTNIKILDTELKYLYLSNGTEIGLEIYDSNINQISLHNNYINFGIKNTQVKNLNLNHFICNKIKIDKTNFERINIYKSEIISFICTSINTKYISITESEIKEFILFHIVCSENFNLVLNLFDLVYLKSCVLNKFMIDTAESVNKKFQLILKNSEFLENMILQNSEFLNIHILNNFISKFVVIKNNSTNNLKIEGNIDDINFRFINFDIKDENSLELDTIITLKKSYEKQGLVELQNKYYAIEKDSYLKNKLNNFKGFSSLKKNRNTLPIYAITKLYSNHGTDWQLAVIMTLAFALGFYSIIYFNQTDYEYYTTLSKNEFWNGYFKFLIITDYTNPVFNYDKKIYFENKTCLWIPNILGKIAIAFGIYETIKSFRLYHK